VRGSGAGALHGTPAFEQKDRLLLYRSAGGVQKTPPIADVFQIHTHDPRLFVILEVCQGFGFIHVHLVAQPQSLGDMKTLKGAQVAQQGPDKNSGLGHESDRSRPEHAVVGKIRGGQAGGRIHNTQGVRPKTAYARGFKSASDLFLIIPAR